MRPVENKYASRQRQHAKARALARLAPTDWWALSLGLAAGAAALLILITSADGTAAAGVLAGASLLIGTVATASSGRRPLD